MLAETGRERSIADAPYMDITRTSGHEKRVPHECPLKIPEESNPERTTPLHQPRSLAGCSSACYAFDYRPDGRQCG